MRISKFIAALIIIAVIWACFFVWIWNYGEELQQHPCQLCSKQIGEDIICIEQGSQNKMIFDSEGGIEVIQDEPIRGLPSYKG